MPPSNQKMIVLRRIAALLIFFAVLFAFAILFYFKYIPGNKEELNQRGHRVLTQIIQNFLDKDAGFREIIANGLDGDSSDLFQQSGIYERLADNMPYETVSPEGSAGDKTGPLYLKGNGDWCLLYKSGTVRGRIPPALSVPMQNFAGLLFPNRDDIFQNYYVLLDSTVEQNTNPKHVSNPKHVYYILARKAVVSESADLNADTLQLLEKNSDKSGTCYIDISGDPNVVFFAPFAFHGERLLMAGLIAGRTYTQKVQSSPVYLTSVTIILISLILASLPLFKIFLLSPNEAICSPDVLRTAISFYLGSVILTIIVFYGFVDYVTHLSLRKRLQTFNTEIRTDIETEIDQANRQLIYYDDTIGGRGMKDGVKNQLADKRLADKSTGNYPIDTVCTPRIYKNVTRLMWGAADGTTLAKWTPFTYPAPFTNLSGYQFFAILDQKPASFDGTPGVDHPVVYPGKSNLNDEFMTCIARRSRAEFSDGRSSFIMLAANLHAALLPVIPQGFGFAVIDNTGNVLIDGDPTRSLAENLYDESGHNRPLEEVVRNRRGDIDFPLELYGKPHVARAAPIAGQPLTLVCYYDDQILTDNFFRYLHFSIQTIVAIMSLLLVCLLASTYKEWSPSLLNFKINRTAWIRPAATNEAQRPFIFIYLGYIILLTLGFFAVIAWRSDNLNNIFYLSMLLPFYVVAGVQLSQVGPEGNWFQRLYRYLAAANKPMACILIVNIVIFLLMGHSGLDRINFVVPVLFQLCILCIKPLIRWDWLSPRIRVKPIDFYQYSVFFSIVLISVLPTAGILSYGFFAEKIQFKKDKLAHLSAAFFERSNYLLNDYFPTIKPTVRKRLGNDYEDSLIYAKSIYLTDRERIDRQDADASGKGDYMGDGLYSLLMDEIYLAPRTWGDAVCIEDTAADLSWRYRFLPGSGSVPGPAIAFDPGRPVQDSVAWCNQIRLISGLRKPQQDFFSLPLIFILFIFAALIILLYLAYKACYETIQRLFVLDVVKSDKIVVDAGYLPSYFQPGKMPPATPYVMYLFFPAPFSVAFFDHERDFDDWDDRPKPFIQEEFILAMADYFKRNYEAIWKDLGDDEKYILFDFSSDRYTNYKNSTVLYKLVSKGILTQKGECLDVFSLSFRQYVLSQGDTDVIRKARENVAGTWDSIRIPLLAVLAIVAVFLLVTQAAFSSSVVAGITTLSTVVPLAIRLFSSSNTAA